MSIYRHIFRSSLRYRHFKQVEHDSFCRLLVILPLSDRETLES